MKNHHNGIHHITVLAGEAQRNATFYVKTLGLRMVKKSVNQDDPGTYHLFYANGEGTPGSDITVFPWPQAVQSNPGVGQAVMVSFAVPSHSKDFWTQRLTDKGVTFEGPSERFGQEGIRFKDPDGLQLELVFDEKVDELPAWEKSTVSDEFGIRGFWGTTLRLQNHQPTSEVLKSVFGFEERAKEASVRLYTTDAPIGGSVIIEEAEPQASTNGRGTVHHVAFRAEDEDELKAMRREVIEMGLHPTEVIDRHWFHSVYFRSPGGVLFEIATDGPGFAVDEDPDKLGEKLILAPWLESRRKEIEAQLPEINV